MPTILSDRDTARLQRMLKWFATRTTRRQDRRRHVPPGGSGLGGMTPFKITDTNLIDDGWYACYEQKLSATMSDANPFSDLNTTEVRVYNIAERDLSGQALSVGDFLMAFQMKDEDGGRKWIGSSPEHSWWHV